MMKYDNMPNKDGSIDNWFAQDQPLKTNSANITVLDW
jgi:hypothetical protein